MGAATSVRTAQRKAARISLGGRRRHRSAERSSGALVGLFSAVGWPFTAGVPDTDWLSVWLSSVTGPKICPNLEATFSVVQRHRTASSDAAVAAGFRDGVAARRQLTRR